MSQARRDNVITLLIFIVVVTAFILLARWGSIRSVWKEPNNVVAHFNIAKDRQAKPKTNLSAPQSASKTIQPHSNGSTTHIVRVVPTSHHAATTRKPDKQRQSSTPVSGTGYHVWASRLLPPTFHATQVIDTSPLTADEAVSMLLNLVRTGHLDYGVSSRYRLPTHWFSQLDLDCLQDPPLTDIDTVPQPASSTVIVHQPGTELQIGDHVTVRVDLRDSRGRQVTNGGHWIRLRMTSADGDRAAAADVQDLKNGSFLASVPVLWAGTTTVHAGMIRPRQFHGTVLRLLDAVKTLLPNMAVYSQGDQSQVTLCSPVPAVPGFPNLCNLTSLNYGLPWYCGQPSRQGLTCGDWLYTFRTACPSNFPLLSKVENDLVQGYLESDFTYKLSQPGSFTTSDDREEEMLLSTAPCWRRPLRHTWTDNSPRGFWRGQEWRPLSCSLPNVTPYFVKRCLHNTTVLLLGDSNTRKMLYHLQSITQCRLHCEGNEHNPIHCFGVAEHTRISFYAHGQPFIVAKLASRQDKLHPSYHLDRIPSTGNYIVVIHFYAHFSFEHTHVIGLHIREAARGVRDLLSRNPSVKVVIRSPHAIVWSSVFLHILGDYHGDRIMRIFRQEFQDLYDRVVFLNVWDMTVANENNDIHPAALPQIVQLFLGHVCPP